jgi:hypothetical protein
LKVTTDGTVLDGLEIRGHVRVEAKNVVIKNSLITGRYLSSPMSLVYANNPAYSVTVQACELYAKEPSPYVVGVIGQNITLERVNIHDVTDQVVVTGDNVTVRDSWLHDNLYYLEDPVQNGTPTHDDNIQVQAGRNLTFTHNTMSGTHNAAIQVTQDAGVVADLRLENNLIGGGGCSVNLAQKNRGAFQGFALKDNLFTHTSTYNCAIIVSPASKATLSLTNNRWANWDGTAWVPESGLVAVQTHAS